MSVDYPGALDMMIPTNYSFDSMTPVAIVCHKTGGDAHLENVHNTFMATMRSTHFAVDTDGRVAQYVPLSRGAGGNCCPDKDQNGNLICDSFWFPLASRYGNLNLCTISIEHCDPTQNNSNPMPQAQVDASNKLIKWLCDTYNIATSHIKGHWSINPVNKPDCPGNTFDFNQLFSYINSGGNTDMIGLDNPYAAAHFKQVATGPTRWACAETGFDLWAGILEVWREMNGAPGLPLGPEVSCGKRAVYKICQAGIVVWDPDKEVPGAPKDSFWGAGYLLPFSSDLAKKLLASAPSAPSAAAKAAVQTLRTYVDAALDNLEKTL